MEFSQIDGWSNAVDQAEHSIITENLPDTAPPGMLFEDTAADGTIRRWQRVLIVGGAPAGRWAYWKAWTENGRISIGPNPQHHAIADTIFNGDVAHFIGMLGVPYAKVPNQTQEAWVLISPRMAGPRPVNLPEEKPAMRYERSKEVFDVETHKTKEIR